MNKFFYIFLFSFSFLFINCASLQFEKTDVFDFNKENNSYKISFDKDSKLSLCVFHIKPLENISIEDISELKAKIYNATNEKIKIKIFIENEDNLFIMESNTTEIETNTTEDVTFKTYQFTEESEIECITIYIEGNLSKGYIDFENFLIEK